MSAAAQLAGVGVRRGDRWILDNVNLDVLDDQRWVLVGPNGAGKTTLLQVLGAQLHPTVGLVEILDEILGAVDVFELRPRIGMACSVLAHRIPESEKVGNMVVSAAWAVVGRWREAYDEQDLARADALLERMGLGGMGDRMWGTLSEGERKRVEIARALMTDPELLLLDEPAAGLDLAGREQLIEVPSPQGKFLPMSAAAQLAGVGVRRGDRWILDNVNLDVLDDQRWVLVGPNGAGKTTLLQVLGAQLHPTVGLVEILDEILGAVDVFELRPRIGMACSVLAHRIPESEKVGNMVVSAAWAVVGRWREAYDEQDLARADALLERMGLGGMGDRMWGTLSEGERKRVEIARALMTDPELLLLDEPAAGLDLAGREQLIEVLSAIFTDPDAPASVLVTHHLEEIPAGITHALVMAEGRIVAAGPVETTLTSEVLSGAFGMPLMVSHIDGRWNARAAR